MAERYAAVVGAVNVDIGGRSAGELVERDSNPGTVQVSLGGVGRNIAHSMALLGCRVKLLTAMGEDLYAQRIERSCQELGIDLSQAVRVAGARTSIYLYIAGPDGDMALALSDMEVCEALDPAFLEGRREALDGAALIVADANLPAASIAWLCEHARAPVFMDPVSTVKAAKLAPVLGKLHTLKPNRLEAQLLSGVEIRDRESLDRAARTLLDTGLERVFVSLGQEGAYAADHSGGVLLPPAPARVVDATGAGDAFMAGLAWAYLEGADLTESAALAQAAAAMAVEHQGTVAPTLSAQAVRARTQRSYPKLS